MNCWITKSKELWHSCAKGLNFECPGTIKYSGMQQGSKIRGGGQVVLGGDNVSPLVEIGLTDPPKSGGGAAAPLPPTLLHAWAQSTFFGTHIIIKLIVDHIYGRNL